MNEAQKMLTDLTGAIRASGDVKTATSLAAALAKAIRAGVDGVVQDHSTRPMHVDNTPPECFAMAYITRTEGRRRRTRQCARVDVPTFVCEGWVLSDKDGRPLAIES